MRRPIAPAVLVGLLLSACGPTTYQLFQRDLSDTQRGCRFLPMGRLVEFAQRCQDRERVVYAKYGHRVDEFTQAEWAYTLAVYDRLDRKEIAASEAHFLITEFKRRMAVEREQLTLARERAQMDQTAALVYWGNFWQSWSQSFQPRTTRPLNCTTTYAGTMANTSCY